MVTYLNVPTSSATFKNVDESFGPKKIGPNDRKKSLGPNDLGPNDSARNEPILK